MDEQPINPPPATAPPARTTKNLSPLATVVTSLVISALVSAGVVKVYHDQFATKVLTVDMRQYVQQLGEQMMAGKMDQAGVEAAMKELNRKIQNDLPPGTVVLLEEVVMTDAKQLRP